MPILGANSSGGSRPSAPVIGSATDGGTGTTASVAFTPSTYIGKGSITYTATSSPGNFTGTASSSPITVSGLTTGTAYTFTVQGTTNYGVASVVSSASNSVTPATPTSFDSIASATPSSGTEIVFSSIPSTYKSLQVRINGITTAGYTMSLRLNGDTAYNYSEHYFLGFGSSTDAGGSGTRTEIIIQNLPPEGGTMEPYPNVAIVDIIDYASTSKFKTVSAFKGAEDNGGGRNTVGIASYNWRSTATVSSITVRATGNWSAGSRISIYGIK
jgi:hypothetical protein